jgi:hypothetical protein
MKQGSFNRFEGVIAKFLNTHQFKDIGASFKMDANTFKFIIKQTIQLDTR